MATINALASRLTGVAPLSVFFDTIQTAGVTQPPTVGGREEYADFEYTWDFDDAGAGTWAKTSKPKNIAYGHVASHVFEDAGTYVVTVDITDGDTVNESHDVTITVTDPDTVYSGTNTVCMSSTGTFTGCPSGATQDTTTTFSDISTHIGNNKRILLCRGDSWNETTIIGLGATGMTIGAYGTGTSPDERGIFTNAPVVNASGSQAKIFDVDGTSDVRVMDLEIANTGTCTDGFEGTTNISELLLLRNNIHDFDSGNISVSHWNTAGNDNDLISIVDNDISEGGVIMVYIGSERLTITGNQCRDAPTSHTLRVWQSYKGVIQHNESSGASYNNSAGRSALKLHGPSAAQLIDTGNGGLDNPTKWTIVADNLFGQCPPTPVSIGPQNAESNEYLEDILVENNRFYSEYGTGSPLSTPLRNHLELHCSYSTARNNVFFGDLSADSYDGIVVSQRGAEPAPTGNRVYNNTIYKSETGTDAIGVNITSAATNTSAINNLVHFNATITNRDAVVNNGTTSTVSNNLLTSASLLVDPENVVYLDKDFRQTASSPSLEGGTTVPVFRDFDDNIRTVTIIDQGAFEYGSTSTVSLTVAGIWEPGVWDTSVWTAGVWDETPFVDPFAALTGTLSGSTEADIVTGGKTTIITLTNDTWIAAGTGAIGTTAQTASIVAGMVSAQSETFGWNNEVTGVLVRDSDTQATITWSASASYNITAQEVLTLTIPADVLVTSATTVVATPTATIDFLDVTAPILSLATGIKTGSTTGSGTVTTDEAGTGYYYASISASETAATIKASGDSKAFTVGINNVSFGSLSPSTAYYAHYVEDDAATNESNVVSSTPAFTTDAYVAPKGSGTFISSVGKLGIK